MGHTDSRAAIRGFSKAPDQHQEVINPRVASPPTSTTREYGCKRGGKRVPAPRPHKPQGSLRGDAVNPHVPLLTCGLCGNPRAAHAEAAAVAVARAQGGSRGRSQIVLCEPPGPPPLAGAIDGGASPDPKPAPSAIKDKGKMMGENQRRPESLLAAATRESNSCSYIEFYSLKSACYHSRSNSLHRKNC
jgi:hypothetical protein